MAGPGMIYLDPTSQFSDLITDRLSFFRQKKALTNFTITAMTDEPKLWCHKVVLAIHSSYFEAMFTTDIGDASPDSVHYDDINPEIMKLILDYMYRERIGFSSDQLMDIITASDFLHIDLLSKRCINEVKAILINDNVVDWLRFAGKHSILNIKPWCMETIGKNFAEISQQTTFINLTYAELHECLVDVLKSDVKPDDILRTVLRWVSDDADSRGKHLEELVQLVQLDNCSMIAISEVLETYQTMIAANVKVLAMLATSFTQKTSPASKATPTEKALVIVGGDVIADSKIGANSQCWSFDRQTKKFKTFCSVPSDELCMINSVCQTPDGFAITGGEGDTNSDMCLLFFASTMSWRKMNNMLRKRSYHGSICVRGMLYVLCGTDNISGQECSSVQCLSLDGGNWLSMPDSPIATLELKVAELHGKIYILHSGDYGVEATPLLEFDVDKKMWSDKTPLKKELDYWWFGAPSMIAVKDLLLVAGGIGNVCVWYNPATDTWCKGQQQPNEEHRHGALVQQDSNTVLLLGGKYITDFGYEDGTDAIEELNLADGSWSVTEYEMPDTIHRHHAFMLDIPKQK